jgi:excisionase family DNA binding protein
MAWHARARWIPCPSSSRPWNRAADMLAEYGAMTSEELAHLLGLNSGNARKHLAILAKEGRAERLPDGQWVLINKQARSGLVGVCPSDMRRAPAGESRGNATIHPDGPTRAATTGMSLLGSQSDRLTTREAAALTGRTQGAVKSAIHDGTLQGERLLDGWRVTRSDVLAWHRRTRVKAPRHTTRQWDKAAELLEEHGSLSAEELAPLIGRHSGNARKYLAILKAEGRAERLPDGQWVLIKRHVGAA